MKERALIKFAYMDPFTLMHDDELQVNAFIQKYFKVAWW